MFLMKKKYDIYIQKTPAWNRKKRKRSRRIRISNYTIPWVFLFFIIF